MSLTNFNYNGKVIAQREDGFVNLTQMCTANGKRIDHWKELKGTKAYISELQENYPESRVVDSIEGNTEDSGTWGHPSLAINLARWISPKFAVWCDAHIFNLMSTGKTSLDIDPIEEMKLKIEYERLKGQNINSEYALTQFRHTIVTTCPEPVQQKILGYTEIKVVEEEEIIVDKRTGERYDGVGIGYITKRYNFKTNKQAWAYLESIGLGKDSEYWKNELSAVTHKKLERSLIDYIDEVFYGEERQLNLGE